MRSKQAVVSFRSEIEALEALSQRLKTSENLADKISILEKQPSVAGFLASAPLLASMIQQLDLNAQYVVKSLLSIGQGPIVFRNFESLEGRNEEWDLLLQQLLEIEKFYEDQSGIIGYQIELLKLLERREESHLDDTVRYERPPGFNLSDDRKEVREVVRWGIEKMGLMGEMYPVGGAGDRLHLQDEETGEFLPAAELLFCGRTLFELLIRDLYGREFLYYKLFGKQLTTPVAIMTSHEKNNHQRILELCAANEWFDRPQTSYRFFIQPLVPMVTAEGEWVVCSPMRLVLKPGGHGVIWKAAAESGIFEWFEKQQKKKILVRQINNPIAGIDTGLLALSGLGCHQNKDFGFASCERLLNAAEGMDVLREVQHGSEYEYVITNVEYTEFKKHGIEDSPVEKGSPYSRFPANTNILFGDLSAIKKAISVCAIPGMLINMKTRVSCHTEHGPVEKFAGRLESTMQNIADVMVDRRPKKLAAEDGMDLRTFLTYNKRRKTISVTKQAYEEGRPMHGTPEGCFYDLLDNYRDLLVNACQMTLPAEQDESDYLANGPDCLVLFHPALGVLYSVISQKIHGGQLAKGSEFILEISEADIKNLDLDGSLIIEAESIMGKKDAGGSLRFQSSYCGKCTLVNVTVRNQGRERTPGKNAWQCQHDRKEALRITLHGNAEFFAEDVLLEGDVHFEVPEGHRLVVYQQGDEIAWHFEKINRATWHWEYVFAEDGTICLEKVKSSI